MKLKAIKYLLPTTDGRLHKELSYLISLHENKMNKGKLHTRLDDLDNRVNELSHKIEQLLMVNRKELPFSKANIKPIESTQELFSQPLTIKQLKESDVLVYEGDFDAFFIKEKEYKIIIRDNNSIGFEIDGDKQYFDLDTIDLSQFTLKAKPSDEPTHDPITSTTLKTPNEWLKLMSEEEVMLWKENRSKSEWELDMNTDMTFDKFITHSFRWIGKEQEYYWLNISLRYNN